MPLVFRGATRVGDANASSVTLPLPAGIVSGDYTLVWVHREDTVVPTFSDTTFEILATVPVTGVTYYLVGKRHTAADSGNLTISFGATVQWSEAEAVTIGGIPAGVWNPLEHFQIATGTGTTFPAVAVTTLDPDPALVWFGDSLSPDADTPPGGFTEVADNSRLTSAAYRLPGSSGTFSTSASPGTHGTSNTHAACLVALTATGSPIRFVGKTGNPATTGAGTGSTAPNPGNDPAVQTGDLAVYVVGTKPDTATIATPAGWNLAAAVAGGGGTTGIDTGPMRIAVFTREQDGSWDGIFPTMSITNGNSSWAQGFVYRKDPGATWDLSAVTGSDSTTGAAWSALMSADPGITAGDLLLAASAIPTDVGAGNQFSAEAVSASGITFGNMTELSEPYTSTGNDAAGFIFSGQVLGGTATAAPTVTATASGTTTNVRGVTALLRIRAVSATGSSGPAALSGSGTLTLAGAPAVPRAVALSGAGTLSTAAVAGVAAPAAFTGSGLLTVAGAPGVPRASSFTGTGTLAATGTAAQAASGTAALSGSGTLAAVATTPTAGGVTGFGGSGSLTVAPVPRTATPVALSGAGTLAAARVPGASSSPSFTGTGSLVVSAVPKVAVARGFTGAGVLEASTANAGMDNPGMSGAGTLSATGTPGGRSTPAFTGTGALTTARTPDAAGGPTLAGAGTLTVAPVVRLAQLAALEGEGTLGVGTAYGARDVVAYAGDGTLSVVSAMGSPLPITAGHIVLRSGPDWTARLRRAPAGPSVRVRSTRPVTADTPGAEVRGSTR